MRYKITRLIVKGTTMPHHRPLAVPALALLMMTFHGAPLVAAEESSSGARQEYRQWIEEMKAEPRGPFERIRWFCNDGTVLPPRAYACAEHGGGHQHGQLDERAVTLRENGYWVANLLAGIDASDWVDDVADRDRLSQTVIERYLVGADDGWILRQALSYRGAFQEEDERQGGRALLEAMAADPWWSGPGFVALRTAVRLLPHREEGAGIQQVRSLAASISDRDAGFMPLRAKIHGAPAAADAARVREYARSSGESALADDYERLAAAIDTVYGSSSAEQAIRELLADEPPASLATMLQETLDALGSSETGARLAVLASAMASVRRGFDDWPADWRVPVLDLSLALEQDFYIHATEVDPEAGASPRSQYIDWLEASATAAYGGGLLNGRLHGALSERFERLDSAPQLALDQWLADLQYFGRAPGWATQAMRLHFFDGMQKLGEIEPLALRFVQDQLRGSPMLFYAAVLDVLSRDAGRLAGVRHQLFGDTVGSGFNALNPGIARGILRIPADLSGLESFGSDGIYVLPETVSDLPPVAGILTAGEGNPLSHVQLLARNLGIPNAAVDERLIAELSAHDGRPVVYAVSRAGLVELSADGPEWDEVFGSEDAGDTVVIEPDIEKLDLGVQRFLPLDGLVAGDSGRTVGPKAAKLGELRDHYPEAVANGLAIPFGLFKRYALDRPHPDHDGSIFEWMEARYAALGPVDPDDAEQARAYEAFRAELYDLIVATPLDEEFRRDLSQTIDEVFGRTPSGLFVRSDTNVEDLAGFTGAGLNLTLPNVQTGDALLEAIPLVWASPFTARAFAWRQSHMRAPEHVYTSILLLESVPSEKSGVLVTADLDSGSRDMISVAVNEGVGGAVDGQAAESLRIDRNSGAVTVLATATAPWRRLPDAAGGLRLEPVSGDDAVLKPDEIRSLLAFVDSLPERFPPITDDLGNPAPADIEFGFIDGQLQLFQLRPFLQSRAASGNEYLEQMDRTLGDIGSQQVDLREAPR